MKPLNHKRKQRILKIKKMYDALGSQPAVARKLGLTRQRISQMLKSGVKHGLFTFSSRHEEELLAWTSKYTRERVLRAIKELDTPSKEALRKTLGMVKQIFPGFLRRFAITRGDIQSDKGEALKRRRLNAYYEIVDALGYHPRYDDFLASKKWRNVSAAIQRQWGGLHNFRKTFGIVPRERKKLPEHVFIKFREHILKVRKEKHAKKQKIVVFLKSHGAHSLRQLSEALGFPLPSTATYLSELTKEKKIRRIGAGNKVRYLIVKHHKTKRK